MQTSINRQIFLSLDQTDDTCHSSEAIPRSLQHRINALLLQPSDAVGSPELSKKSCSPRACDTNLYSLEHRKKYGHTLYVFLTTLTFHGKLKHILWKRFWEI